MTALHWNVLLIYGFFLVIATLLAFARRWLRPNGTGESIWRKYPLYIFINLCFVAAGWLPPNWHALTILLGLLGAFASWEISSALKLSSLAFYFAAITFTGIVLADFLQIEIWLKAWLALMLVVFSMGTLTRKPEDYPAFAFAIAGCLIYLPICLATFIWIQQNDPAGFRAAFLYLVIATNDAFAQIIGQSFGRRQLAPQISPAKTVEGAIGGLLFAVAMAVALGQSIGMTHIIAGVIGFTIGLAGLIGDLTASMWKRALGKRNYSAMLGAQGGVMDRFDGLIFAAPVFYLLITIAV